VEKIVLTLKKMCQDGPYEQALSIISDDITDMEYEKASMEVKELLSILERGSDGN